MGEKITINPIGFNHDIAAAELGPDVWNFGANVVFENGFATGAPGWAEVAPGMLCKPLYMLPVFTGLSYWWIYCGNNVGETGGFVGVTDGVDHYDITPAAGLQITAAGDWTGDILNGVPVLNSRFDEPFFWDTEPLNICQPLPAWPANTRAGALRAFKYHLIAMNITDSTGDYPDLVIWSDAADPGSLPDSWAPLPENQAGNFTISTGQGGLVDGGQLRDEFMLYKTGTTTIMHYVAGQFVFSNRKAFVTTGILARNCWAEMFGQHYLLTDGDFVRHNGQQVTSLIDGVNKNFIFDQIDSENYTSSHICASHTKGSIWINFPKSGHVHPDTALVFDLNTHVYGLVDFDDEISFMTRGIFNKADASNDFDDRLDTFDQAGDRFNSSLLNPTHDLLAFCRYEPQKILVLEGYLREGQPVAVLMQLLSKDFGLPQQLKLVTAVWPASREGGDQDAGIFAVRVGTQLTLDDPIKWSALTAVGQYQKAPFLQSGRYISLEYFAVATADWQLTSTDVDFERQGQW